MARKVNAISSFNITALVLGMAFLYLPIVILVIYSFNASRLVTVWGGWSLRWYHEFFNDRAMLDAAWMSLRVAAVSATIAGAISGSVTATNARTGLQPRSIAASSSERSSEPRRDCTTTATKHIVSVVWAIVTVQKPRSALSATNSSNSDNPVITSGITSGA